MGVMSLLGLEPTRVAEDEERTFYRTLNPGYNPVSNPVVERFVPLRKYAGDRLIWPAGLSADTVYPARVNMSYVFKGEDTVVMESLRNSLGTSADPITMAKNHGNTEAIFPGCRSFREEPLVTERAKLVGATLWYILPEDRHPWIGTESVMFRFLAGMMYYRLQYRGKPPSTGKQRQTLESKVVSSVPDHWFPVAGRQEFWETED
ncbi:MAG: hypothetical protein HY362_03965 [Candidatus Aenigmarchaeota archaeon]|nr:hypothetical protein [Candidatus Aenigmarchaeota archaeon]